MAYLKRQSAGKFWPVSRKGTAYLAIPSHNKKASLPLIIAVRDVLGLVKSKKELKKAIIEKLIKINEIEIKNTNHPLVIFDVLNVNGKKYKTIIGENKKFRFEEVTGKNSETKTIKVIGKKILGKDRIQLNLMDGRNILFNDKITVGDSLVYDFKNKKITVVIKIEKEKNAFVFSGKHAGKKGKIENIIERRGKKLAKINTGGDKINVWIKNIIVI